MPKTQLNGSVSPGVTLEIGMAFGHFVSIFIDPWAKAGNPIIIAFILENSGDLTATFHVDFDHTDANGNWEFTGERSEFFTLAGGERKEIYTTVNSMPLRDIKYRARSYHDDVTPNADETSVEKIIEVLSLIDTSLTCTIFPTRVARLTKYTQSGKLTRNDTGVGVADQPLWIEIFAPNPNPPPDNVWIIIATNVRTDVNGNYSIQITAPNPATVPVTYQVRTEYVGSVAFGLGASVSSIAGVQVGIIETLENVAIIGLAGAGAFLIGSALARKTRKKIIVLPLTAAGLVAGYAIQKARGRI